MADISHEHQIRETFEKVRQTVDTEKCVMYSTTVCPWCTRAQEFVNKFGKQCKSIQLDEPENKMTGAVVAAATNQRTVPNIFINGMHVGGYDSLIEVEKQCRTEGSTLKGDEQFKGLCGFFMGNSGEA